MRELFKTHFALTDKGAKICKGQRGLLLRLCDQLFPCNAAASLGG